jgi:[acyl-carrier-protein] S-malonyltransferase
MAESISGLPLRNVIENGPEDLLRNPAYLEPSIFAVQAAHTLLLQEDGMQPDVVAGYSLGEIGAVYCAGCLSLIDALSLVSARGKILARSAVKGEWSSRALTFVNKPETAPMYDGVFVAAYNGPRDFTITGAAKHINAAERILSKERAAVLPVAIDGPWHSPLAGDSAREIATLMRTVELRKPLMPVCLGTSGAFETDVEAIRASLSRQIDNPVRWTEALDTLWQAGVRATLELGPGRVLTSFVRANWAGRDYRSQFLDRQGGRALDFAALRENYSDAVRPVISEENSWTQSA